MSVILGEAARTSSACTRKPGNDAESAEGLDEGHLCQEGERYRERLQAVRVYAPFQLGSEKDGFYLSLKSIPNSPEKILGLDHNLEEMIFLVSFPCLAERSWHGHDLHTVCPSSVSAHMVRGDAEHMYVCIIMCVHVHICIHMYVVHVCIYMCACVHM